MRRRVRWENVLRVVAAALLVAVVVAWPRLAPPDPGLPGRGAVPLDPGRPDPLPAVVDEPRARRRTVVREEPARRRDDGERRRAEKRSWRMAVRRKRAPRPRTVEVAPPPPAASPTPAPTASAPPVAPTESEFGFERGG